MIRWLVRALDAILPAPDAPTLDWFAARIAHYREQLAEQRAAQPTREQLDAAEEAAARERAMVAADALAYRIARDGIWMRPADPEAPSGGPVIAWLAHGDGLYPPIDWNDGQPRS